MSHRGWTRLASGAGSRALKYRHLLDETLDALARRELVTRERRPGQKEERYMQLLGAAEAQRTEPQGLTLAVPDRLSEIEARLAKLEAAFAELSARLDS